MTKAWIPQLMNTTEANTIQRELFTASSVFPDREKHTRATKASAIPTIPSFETLSFRNKVERMTVTMGATEIIGSTR